MAIIKLSAIERRRLSAFFTCLIIAFVIWVLVTLSGTYKYTVKQAVNFKNLPQKRAFHSLQSDTVDVTMMGTGWQMLISKMQSADKALDIDLHTLENKSFVVLNNQLPQINALHDTINYVVSINPDTLYFDFTNRMIKRVPVTVLNRISYEQGYAQSGRVQIRPHYVTVSGPINRIQNLEEWPTDSLRLKDINEDYSGRLNLRPVNDGSLVIVPKQVEVRIPVDEFTEKTLEIPIKLINHNFDNVKIFPQKVKVTFTVSLNKYAETDEDFFDAVADLDLWRSKGYTTLPVQLPRIPSFCKIVNIEPKSIDFIVKK